MVYIFLIPLISALEFPINIKSVPDSYLNNSIALSKHFLKNFYDIEFSIPFFIGTPQQKINLCITLSHRYTTIPLVGCNCHKSSNRFSPLNSLSFENSSEVFDYGTSYGFKGNWAKDTFMIKDTEFEESEFEKIEFVGVNYDSGYNYIDSDGFLGLGLGYENERHQNIIMQMKDKDYIDDAIFSIFIGNRQNSQKKPTFTIDSWNIEEYGSDEEVTIIVDKSSHLWETKINSFLVGYNLVFSGSAKLNFNIGSSGIIIDAVAFNVFSSDLIKAVSSCILNKSYFVCSCNSENNPEFPDITVVISSNSFVIHAENYLLYLGQGKCKVEIFSNGGNGYWTLGLPYFREYYNMFDIEKKEIHVSRSYSGVTSYSIWDSIYQFLGNIFAVLGIVFVVFICIACIIARTNKKDLE